MVFSVAHPFLMFMYFFAGSFLISSCVWPNSGFGCCVCLTLQITLLSRKDFEFVSIIRYGDLELVFLFQQSTSIITNVMLHIWFVVFLLLSTTFAWLSFIDFLLTSCCGIHNWVLVIHFSFTNYVSTLHSEVLKCGLRPDIGKSMDELHLFTYHVIHEHGIEISIMFTTFENNCNQ